MEHKNATLNHKLENWTYANAAARTSASGFVTADLGKIAYQSDDGTYWRLTVITPTWAQVGGSGIPDGGSTGQVLTKVSGTDGDADWETPSSGGGSVSGGYNVAPAYFLNGSTAEACFLGILIPAGKAGNTTDSDGIHAVRIRLYGTLKGGGTLATFTPRLRWGTTEFSVAGTVILATPTVVAANNTSGAPMELEAIVMFTNPDVFTSMSADAMIRWSEHTSDAGGLLKTDFNNTKTTPVSIGNVTTDKYLNFTMQLSATGTASFYVIGGTYEFIGNSDPAP